MPLTPASLLRYARYTQIPVTVEANFARGILRDVPRSAIPPGGVYDLFDYLVNSPGVIQKRGGCGYQSSALSGQDIIIGCAAPEFPGDPRVIAFASDSSNTTLFDVTTGTHATGVNCLGGGGNENMSLYVDRLIMTTDGTGSGVVRKIYLDSGVVAIAPLGGLPPAASVSTIHLNYLVLANTAANPNYLYFSPLPSLSEFGFAVTSVSTGSSWFKIAGDHTFATDPINGFQVGQRFSVWGSTGNNGRYTVTAVTFASSHTQITVAETVSSATADGTLGAGWDTDNAYLDVHAPIIGLASVQGVLLVFTRGTATRILGTFPPGSVDANDVPNGDMSPQPLGAVGCVDARSIVTMNNLVYFANESGIYYTNGAGCASITTKVGAEGISELWENAMAGFAPENGALVCCGVWQNQWLFVSIRHPTGPVTYQFLWYEPGQAWMRLSDGVAATMYATRFAPNGELYAGWALATSDPSLMTLSPIFTPTSGNVADATGADVLPLVEFRPAGVGPGLHHYDFSEISYDMRSSSSPELLVTLATGLEAPLFSSAQEGGTLAKTTKSERGRVMLARESQALTMRVTQSGASDSTELFAVEYAIRPDPLGFGGADEP